MRKIKFLFFERRSGIVDSLPSFLATRCLRINSAGKFGLRTHSTTPTSTASSRGLSQGYRRVGRVGEDPREEVGVGVGVGIVEDFNVRPAALSGNWTLAT